jgi:hypothetical protein
LQLESTAAVQRAPRVRRSTVPRPPALRSAVTNGTRMFVDGDQQSPWARRRRDLESLIAGDLGGADTLSEIQLGLVATAATLRVELEQCEGQLSKGETVDLESYARVAGHYRRICETFGVSRCAKDVTPGTLRERALAAQREV